MSRFEELARQAREIGEAVGLLESGGSSALALEQARSLAARCAGLLERCAPFFLAAKHLERATLDAGTGHDAAELATRNWSRVCALGQDLRRMQARLEDLAESAQVDLAQDLARAGRADQALDLLARSLLHRPHAPEVRAALDILAAGSGAWAERARLLAGRCLRPAGRLGEGVLSRPISLLALPDEGQVLVSDQDQGAVFRFSLTGEFLGALVRGLEQPMGLFRGPDGLVWVCLTARRALLGLDRHGATRAELPLPAGFTPFFGAALGAFLWVAAVDSRDSSRALFGVRSENPGAAWRRQEPPAGFSVTNVAAAGERLLLVSSVPPGLLLLDPDSGQTQTLDAAEAASPLRRCRLGHGELLMTCGGRFQAQGRDGVHFRLGLQDLAGDAQACPSDFAVLASGVGERVFVSDIGLHCVHVLDRDAAGTEAASQWATTETSARRP